MKQDIKDFLIYYFSIDQMRPGGGDSNNGRDTQKGKEMKTNQEPTNKQVQRQRRWVPGANTVFFRDKERDSDPDDVELPGYHVFSRDVNSDLDRSRFPIDHKLVIDEGKSGAVQVRVGQGAVQIIIPPSKGKKEDYEALLGCLYELVDEVEYELGLQMSWAHSRRLSEDWQACIGRARAAKEERDRKHEENREKCEAEWSASLCVETCYQCERKTPEMTHGEIFEWLKKNDWDFFYEQGLAMCPQCRQNQLLDCERASALRVEGCEDCGRKTPELTGRDMWGWLKKNGWAEPEYGIVLCAECQAQRESLKADAATPL